ncbi:hypothetical protein, partial [Campylobacter helveticus]|uniref:hypothetical protein n=2 Tax=Campylobacter helveticus TaxID=28898 RepID=UPI00214A6F0A
KMTKKELRNLIKECGFCANADLAAFLHTHSQTLVYWNQTGKYPKYLKQLLEWYILIKNYKENTLSVEELKVENKKLEEELEKLERESNAKN